MKNLVFIVAILASLLTAIFVHAEESPPSPQGTKRIYRDGSNSRVYYLQLDRSTVNAIYSQPELIQLGDIRETPGSHGAARFSMSVTDLEHLGEAGIQAEITQICQTQVGSESLSVRLSRVESSPGTVVWVDSEKTIHADLRARFYCQEHDKNLSNQKQVQLSQEACGSPNNLFQFLYFWSQGCY